MLLTPPPSPHLKARSTPEDRLGQILLDRIQLAQVIGVGAYGVVYKAVDIQTGELYAVKVLDKFGLTPRQRHFHQRELNLHYKARHHPNIVSLYQIQDYDDCTFVIMEYCPDSDLFVNITERGQYVGRDALARSAFLQIIDAVSHCHSLGIYHRDLKPENILTTNNGATLKLADFGLATTDPVSSDFGCGSTFYMSPECQQTDYSPYSSYATAPNDVWSLGVILVNLTCGRNPWKRASLEDPTFSAFLRDSEFLKSILPLTDELDCILRRIFECDPQRRIGLAELRELVVSCPAFTLPQSSSKSRTSTPATQKPQPQPQPQHQPQILPGVFAPQPQIAQPEPAALLYYPSSPTFHVPPPSAFDYAYTTSPPSTTTITPPESPAPADYDMACSTPNSTAPSPTHSQMAAPSAAAAQNDPWASSVTAAWQSTWWAHVMPALSTAQRRVGSAARPALFAAGGMRVL